MFNLEAVDSGPLNTVNCFIQRLPLKACTAPQTLTEPRLIPLKASEQARRHHLLAAAKDC